jgi:hypothetical protein
VIHTLLPDQYLTPPTFQLALPQRRLMMAVLQTVVDDVLGPMQRRRAAGRHGSVDERDRARARAYVTSTDRSWPFSFENVCEAIGVDADRLRGALEQLLADAA